MSQKRWNYEKKPAKYEDSISVSCLKLWYSFLNKRILPWSIRKLNCTACVSVVVLLGFLFFFNWSVSWSEWHFQNWDRLSPLSRSPVLIHGTASRNNPYHLTSASCHTDFFFFLLLKLVAGIKLRMEEQFFPISCQFFLQECRDLGNKSLWPYICVVHL